VTLPPALAARAEALLQRQWWRPQISPLGWLLLPLLWPLSALYGALFSWQQRRQRLQAYRAPVPVVVVGNVVVGGAGKTPTVIALVQALQAAGWRPAVISRGYGRTATSEQMPQRVHAQSPAHSVGDEPLLIQRRTGVPVWVGANRAAVAQAACQHCPEVNVLVSDDGLQHAALARDVECIVFDERGAGNGWLLPAGPLRQPLPTAPLPVHQHLLYTHGSASTPLPGHLARRSLGLAWPLQAWWAGETSTAQPLQTLAGRPLLAAAGLAAPFKFFNALASAGLAVQPLPLPDHFSYDTLPWAADCKDVITTEKDAVKIDPRRLGSTRVWVVPLDLQLPAELLGAVLSQVEAATVQLGQSLNRPNQAARHKAAPHRAAPHEP
jgi:tetraacyldisaccharide 4'-kinase